MQQEQRRTGTGSDAMNGAGRRRVPGARGSPGHGLSYHDRDNINSAHLGRRRPRCRRVARADVRSLRPGSVVRFGGCRQRSMGAEGQPDMPEQGERDGHRQQHGAKDAAMQGGAGIHTANTTRRKSAVSSCAAVTPSIAESLAETAARTAILTVDCGRAAGAQRPGGEDCRPGRARR